MTTNAANQTNGKNSGKSSWFCGTKRRKTYKRNRVVVKGPVYPV
jgi:hypothetical protein